jgi:glutaredoxin
MTDLSAAFRTAAGYEFRNDFCCGSSIYSYPLSDMKPSLYLLQHTARLTLFTRANCSLCETAKAVISTVEKRRDFQYVEIDVMAPGQKQWKDLYEFDTPVVRSPFDYMTTQLTWYAIVACTEGSSYILQA